MEGSPPSTYAYQSGLWPGSTAFTTLHMGECVHNSSLWKPLQIQAIASFMWFCGAQHVSLLGGIVLTCIPMIAVT